MDRVAAIRRSVMASKAKSSSAASSLITGEPPQLDRAAVLAAHRPQMTYRIGDIETLIPPTRRAIVRCLTAVSRLSCRSDFPSR
jgi:hypothetical protein